ncbi:MAG: DUF4469 domain-containing protein [Rectinemataceae bacterium]|jgi:hypothetical protein
MAVNVALVKDPIRKDGGLMHRVVQRNKVGFDKFLSFMDKTTGLSEQDIRSVFLQVTEALAFYLPDGSEVQTPLGAFKLNMHYRAPAGTRTVPPQDRKISSDDMNIQLRADRGLLDRIRLKSSINIVDAPTILTPSITRVENADLAGAVGSGSSGQILHIIGNRLGFDKDDQEQGVFLVADTADGAATRMVVYSRMGSNIVDGKIPQLAPGNYKLEVRTRPTDKDIRVGVYDGVIALS